MIQILLRDNWKMRAIDDENWLTPSFPDLIFTDLLRAESYHVPSHITG
ncbi:hypothetical protein [Ferroacidibacillus organovorans]|nr:hypothetical protein [Ferroacidibacillus organovorans]